MLKKNKEIMDKFYEDWSFSFESREASQRDAFFERVNNWDDQLAGFTAFRFRGQFDEIKPQVKRMITEMLETNIDVSFKSSNKKDESSAKILDGLYRYSMTDNASIEAKSVAARDMLETGAGAWRLVTEYDGIEGEIENNQIIKREKIDEALLVLFGIVQR